jgi:amino acid permease
MRDFWLQFVVFVVAVGGLVLASSHDFGWTMAALGMMMLLAVLALLFAGYPRWDHLPFDSEVRKRRESRTILDILGNEKEL